MAEEVRLEFDDSKWSIVDLPHDASVERGYSPNAPGPEGFIPAVQTFYRKHMRLPEEWHGMAISIEVDAALISSSWWVNGIQVVPLKVDGYLPLILRLDTVAGLNLSYGKHTNIIAAWTDDSTSSGWWYEGGGLFRQ